MKPSTFDLEGKETSRCPHACQEKRCHPMNPSMTQGNMKLKEMLKNAKQHHPEGTGNYGFET